MDIAKIAEKLGTDKTLVIFLQACEQKQREYDNWMIKYSEQVQHFGHTFLARRATGGQKYAPDHPVWENRSLLEKIILEDGYLVEMGDRATLYINIGNSKKVSLNLALFIGATKPDACTTLMAIDGPGAIQLRLWWD